HEKRRARSTGHDHDSQTTSPEVDDRRDGGIATCHERFGVHCSRARRFRLDRPGHTIVHASGVHQWVSIGWWLRKVPKLALPRRYRSRTRRADDGPATRFGNIVLVGGLNALDEAVHEV